MLFFALPTALLALVPAFLSSPVAASPAAQPQVTPLAQLEARANGANIIGYSSSGTGLRTRSCNNGFFSSSGTLGNCCASASCAYITACRSSYVFYAGGSSAFCGSTGSCGTGVVLKTVGDSSPLSVFNCDSNWRVTATLSASSTSSDRPTTVTSVRTTGTTATVISSITQAAAAAIVSVTSATAQLSSSALSLSASSQTPVTLTVTSPIAGGIVGGIALIALAALGIFFLLRRKSKQVPTAVPVNNNPEYFAPTAGSQQMNDGQPPRFSQVEYMNNPPAMAQTGYPQNQAYAAYVPPIAMAGKHQQDYKYVPQQDIKDGQRGVETNVVPSGPLTPMEHPQEVYGSPVPTPGLIPHPGPGPQEVYGSPVVHPVEMPAHAR
ncbi:hypothetical protein BLS_001181 [Venturia inaequalis]|uniref:Transmembrane protein n=1 Tax=Venturia inaequalis TaxID=5025 RepID=A0A8H3U2A2_VENIN|nr:hypothetical protein BLS_001181 [Venturia inaequalis]